MLFPNPLQLTATVLCTTLLDVGRGLLKLTSVEYCPGQPATPFRVRLGDGPALPKQDKRQSVRKSDTPKGDH